MDKIEIGSKNDVLLEKIENRDGEIVKKYIGPIDKESLDKIIDEILEKE